MYKIIQDNKIIDIVEHPRFVSFLTSGHIAITDKTSAHGIVGSDNKTIYIFNPLINNNTVTIESVTAKEFSRLQSLLNSGQEVSTEDPALIQARQDMTKRLSRICHNKITSGFSVVLSDGKSYSFKLTSEDQLNLMSLESQLNYGAETFLYHATNQPCKFFSREDMFKIINTSKQYILYHTTYFNIAKQYISTLTDIEKINTFTYGKDVSSVVDDIIIKQILKNGGNSV